MSITHVLSIVSRDRWSQVPPIPYFQRFLILHLKLTHCFSRCDHSFHWCIAKAYCLKLLLVSFRFPSTSFPNSIKDHACCNFCVLKNRSPTIQKTALNQLKPSLRLCGNDQEEQCTENILSSLLLKIVYYYFTTTVILKVVFSINFSPQAISLPHSAADSRKILPRTVTPKNSLL